MLPHNIDFHAATGALGGGELTLVNPGEQAVLRFKADLAPACLSITARRSPDDPLACRLGKSGAIMILPRDGLKDGDGNALRYDKVFYIGEHDLYVPRDENGKFRTTNPPATLQRYG